MIKIILLKAHYIDQFTYCMKSINLDLIYIPPPLYGVTIALELMKTIREWYLENKIFAVTTDSGANCFLASKLLNGQKSKKTNIDFDKSIMFCNRCSAHSLQNVVKFAFENCTGDKKDNILKKSLSKLR